MKRKVLSLIVAGLLMVGIAGCGTSSNNNANQTTAGTATPNTEAATTTTTTTTVESTTKVETTTAETTATPEEKTEFKVGETWTVEGQWSLTVNSIEETAERNEFFDADHEPGAVYIVTYTYENLGWEEDYFSGIFFSMDNSIVDCEGFMGYSYPGDVTYYAQETPIGAKCKAQACIGVDNAGLPIKITEEKYDTNDNYHSATFIIE